MKFLGANVNITTYARARRHFLADDGRILEVAEAPRSFCETVAEMGEGVRRLTPASPLEGPPTIGWWLDDAARENRSLVTLPIRWRGESGIHKNAAFGSEHEIISRALELGCCIDGFNLKRSVMGGFLVRRLQLGESAALENPD